MKKVSAVTPSVRQFLAKLCLISAFSPPRSQNLLDFVNDMAVKYSLYPESPEFYFAVTDYKLVVLYKQKTGLFVVYAITEISLQPASLSAESTVFFQSKRLQKLKLIFKKRSSIII